MYKILKPSLVALAAIAFLTSEASAQYYNPGTVVQNNAFQPGLGLSLDAQNGGLNPNAGFGFGPVGAGAGLGLGRNGIGAGANTGVGPLGITADGGLGRNGLGLRGSGGIGNTGAAFDGGISDGGVGVGANARLFGFGPGASLGIGNRGPGLGASFAFGPLGSIRLGSHRNSYPGAQQTAAHINANQGASYYAPQNFGRTPYYRPVPVQRPLYQPAPVQRQIYRPYVQPQYQYSASRCPQNWVC